MHMQNMRVSLAPLTLGALTHSTPPKPLLACPAGEMAQSGSPQHMGAMLGEQRWRDRGGVELEALLGSRRPQPKQSQVLPIAPPTTPPTVAPPTTPPVPALSPPLAASSPSPPKAASAPTTPIAARIAPIAPATPTAPRTAPTTPPAPSAHTAPTMPNTAPITLAITAPSIALVWAEFIVALDDRGLPLPSDRAALPAEAFASVPELQAATKTCTHGLPIVCFSCPWSDTWHLSRLAGYLRGMLRSGERRAVYWSRLSLEHPTAHATSGAAVLFSHPQTIVTRLTAPAPPAHDTNEPHRKAQAPQAPQAPAYKPAAVDGGDRDDGWR